MGSTWWFRVVVKYLYIPPSVLQVQSDLVKDGGHLYFIKHLESRDPGISPESRAQAAFVLAAICNRHSKGQLLCAQAGLLQVRRHGWMQHQHRC